MNIDRIILVFAGTIILVSVALGVYVSSYWFVLTAFVGLNMIQSAFTRFCPLALILKRLGFKSGSAFK